MPAAFELTNVHKAFSGGLRRGPKTLALDGLTLAAAGGERIALLGANGSGKSTLLRLLAGLLTPDTGTVRVLGEAPAERLEARARLGLCTGDERSLLLRLTPRENLRFFGSLYSVDGAELQRRIEALADELGFRDQLDRPTYALSSGNRARLLVGRALIHEPELILLDEGTHALDVAGAERLRGMLRARTEAGACLVFVTHNAEEAEALGTRVVRLEGGRVVPTPTAAATPTGDRTRGPVRSSASGLRGSDAPGPRALADASASASVDRTRGPVRSSASGLRGSDAPGPRALADASASASVAPTASAVRLALAWTRKATLEELSYRGYLALEAVGGLVTLLGLFYFSRLVGASHAHQLGTEGYFAFACVGLAAYLPARTAQAELARQVRAAQLVGLLEPLAVTPLRLPAQLLAMAVQPTLGALVRAGLTLSAGSFLFGLRIEATGLGWALLALGLAAVASAGLGLCSAAVVLHVRRSDPVAYLLDAAAWLGSGLLFPVALLPGWAQAAAELLPATHALRLVRSALLPGNVAPMAGELIPLAALAILAVAVGWAALTLAVRSARQTGALGIS